MYLAFNRCNQPYKEKGYIYIYIPNNSDHSVVGIGIT